MSERITQRARILKRLIAAKGAEVPSYELAQESLQYSARIHELRHDLGFQIVSRTERRNGAVHGFFRIELGAKKPPSSEPQQPEPTLLEMPTRFEYPD
jgi:hypothetical protein